jgi:3-oxoacyl-[acyl-carrier protein] reductase
VLVTGGGRGIGQAICLAFAKEGSKVACNSKTESGLEVVKRITESNGDALFLQADVALADDAARIVHQTIEKYGTIDVLVNNAGISPKKEGGGPAMTWEVALEEWDLVMDTNLKGTLICSQEAIKHMIPKKSGAIVNMTSVAGKAPNEPMPTGAHYGGSKAAIINLTQRLASEVAHLEIRVNAVAPGRIATPLATLASEQVNKAMLDRTPMGRFGTGEEVANCVVFLASDAAGYVTGETMNINGGWFMD